jgi:hypothetical protein
MEHGAWSKEQEIEKWISGNQFFSEALQLCGSVVLFTLFALFVLLVL